MKPSNWVYWNNRLAVAGWLAFMLLVLTSVCCRSAHADVFIAHQAKMQITTATKVLTLEGQPLPFRWDLNFPGENGHVRYTINLPPRTVLAEEPYAIYIPRLGNQVQAFLNGQMMTAPIDLDNTTQDSSKTPIWIVAPTALLFEDRSNVLILNTGVQAMRWGGLSELYFGPETQLRARYSTGYQWQQSSYIVILVALLLMGIISWMLWLGQRDEAGEGVYGLFALSAVWGGLSALDQLMTTAWLPWPLQGIVASVALASHVIFMTRFTLGIVSRTGSWVRLTLLATTIAIGVAYILAEPVYWTIAFGFLCIPIAAAFIYTARAADYERSAQARVLFVVSSVASLTALRDFFALQWPESGMNEFALLPHALFLYVLMMGWILVQRYTEQHHKYHELNISLEQRVTAREQQLVQSFDQIKMQGEEQAKLLERQRIMSDIHDGVGGQLVGLVNMLKRGETNHSLFDQKQLSEYAQTALDELRVAVDSMQPVDGDLATVLATLRYRLEPRLRASDIALVWQVDMLPVLNDLTPQKVLQIQRILLEAFTNIIQHAQAKTVTVTAKHLPDMAAVQIVIADDGIGFDINELKARGHGLHNMYFRAEAIGALMTFERTPHRGVNLTLTLPIS